MRTFECANCGLEFKADRVHGLAPVEQIPMHEVALTLATWADQKTVVVGLATVLREQWLASTLYGASQTKWTFDTIPVRMVRCAQCCVRKTVDNLNNQFIDEQEKRLSRRDLYGLES